MEMRPLILLFIPIICLACWQSTGSRPTVNATTGNTSAELTPTPNETKQVYDFMRFVIKDQKLDTTHSLSDEPEKECNSGPDEEYLLTLIDNRKLTKPDNDTARLSGDSLFGQPIEVYNISAGPFMPKCLNEGDIPHILAQKARFKNFKWNGDWLGFSKHNDSNWYSFSIPLFSKDGNKAIVKIESLCRPFLCGSGQTLLYEKENSTWKETGSLYWWH